MGGRNEDEIDVGEGGGGRDRATHADSGADHACSPVLVGVVMVAVLSKLPKMGALAALTGGLVLTWGLVGASGIATLVGERLWGEAAPWRQTLRGGLVLMGCALLPGVGWVVLLPLLGVLGCGLHLRARFVKALPISAPEIPLPQNP